MMLDDGERRELGLKRMMYFCLGNVSVKCMMCWSTMDKYMGVCEGVDKS